MMDDDTGREKVTDQEWTRRQRMVHSLHRRMWELMEQHKSQDEEADWLTATLMRDGYNYRDLVIGLQDALLFPEEVEWELAPEAKKEETG